MRVLITSVSSGSGHVRAAEALHAAFQEAHPDVSVEHVNVLDHIHPTIRKIYEDGYAFVADHAPGMWRLLYDTTDKQGNHGGVQRALNALQRQGAAPFLEFLDRWKPDAILSTHFLAPQLLSSAIIDPSIPVEVVITDYDLHRLWINRVVRRYYVADEGVAQKGHEFGLRDDRFVVTGIPIHPCFSQIISRENAHRLLGLSEDKPAVLLLSGGMGFGNVERAFKSLLEIRTPFQLLTVAGKNQVLKRKLGATSPPQHIECRHFGFVSNMHEFLSAADVVVTKSGGLTTAESLAKGVPMVIFTALPGQETKNAEFVESVGAGIFVKQPAALKANVEKLVSSAGERFRFQIQARATGRPQAAFDIAKNVIANLSFVR